MPPDAPDPEADAELLRLIYEPLARPANVVQSMADYADEDWQYVLERWEALRAYHRQHILDNPGCIAIDETITDPDPTVQAAKRAAKQRLDRQQWLSRLLVATPRMLAAAEYARIRRHIEPEGGAVADHSRGRGKGKGRGDVVVAAPEPPKMEPIIPIGFVSGATPKAGTVVAVPQIADATTAATIMETRGRRRAKDDIAEGFDDLATPDDSEEGHSL